MVNHSTPLPTDPAFNGKLAKTNTDRALKALSDKSWWTVQMLAKSIGSTETSASSALRDLRKPKCGTHNVVRRRLANGLSEYRLFNYGETPGVAELTGAGC